MASLTGACSCGVVRVAAATEIRRIVNCHCNACRRMNGGAFSSYLVVPHETLSVAGDEHVTRYEVSPGALKHFCSKCGTPLYNVVNRYPGACMIYLGAIDPQPADAPALNVYCESMLSWVERIGSIPKLPTGTDRK